MIQQIFGAIHHIMDDFEILCEIWADKIF